MQLLSIRALRVAGRAIGLAVRQRVVTNLLRRRLAAVADVFLTIAMAIAFRGAKYQCDQLRLPLIICSFFKALSLGMVAACCVAS